MTDQQVNRYVLANHTLEQMLTIKSQDSSYKLVLVIANTKYGNYVIFASLSQNSKLTGAVPFIGYGIHPRVTDEYYCSLIVQEYGRQFFNTIRKPNIAYAMSDLDLRLTTFSGHLTHLLLKNLRERARVTSIAAGVNSSTLLAKSIIGLPGELNFGTSLEFYQKNLLNVQAY